MSIEPARIATPGNQADHLRYRPLATQSGLHLDRFGPGQPQVLRHQCRIAQLIFSLRLDEARQVVRIVSQLRPVHIRLHDGHGPVEGSPVFRDGDRQRRRRRLRPVPAGQGGRRRIPPGPARQA